jgi:hypothetical protein
MTRSTASASSASREALLQLERRGQAARGESGEQEHRSETDELDRRVVADECGEGHERGERDERQRQTAMEPSRLKPGPVVEETYDLPPFVRVRARRLARACVAHLRPPSVADEAALAIELVRPEVLTFGTLPSV